MKLKIIKFICYLWDVTFTVIDLFQLKVWYYLVKYKEKLEYEEQQRNSDFNNLEDWNSWEDVQ